MENGQIFDEKYEILGVLGKGGMGTVYLAKNIKLETLWAIKTIDKKNEDEFDLLAEPNILKKLNHHALPRIFDIIEDSQRIYIVEDYIEGLPLDKELKRLGSFKEQQVVEWAKQICDALKYLHSLKPNPIIYRDMKPQNLIISKENEMKIIDFGIAREYKKESTDDTTYIGTRGYAAPEQYGKAQTDARTDIYSLGVTLYHMLTGKSPNDPPYEIKPVRKYNNKLSMGIEYIIEKCTRQDPARRYQTVDALIKDLKNIKKFDKEYKKKELKKDLIIGSCILLFIFSALLTHRGWKQLQQEKVDLYKDMIQQGIILREDGNHDEAIDTFKSAMQKMPENPIAFKEKVMVYYDLRDYEKVIEHIDENIGGYHSARLLPEHSETFSLLEYIKGFSHYEINDYQKAAEHMSIAYDKLEWDSVLARNYAVSLARSGLLDEAGEVLLDAKQKGIYDDAAIYIQGEIMFQKEEYQEAETYFLDALDITEDEDIKRRSFIALAETYRLVGTDIPDALDLEIEILKRAKRELQDKSNIVVIERLADAYSIKAGKLTGEKRDKYLILSAEQFEYLLSLGYIRPYIMRNISILYQNAGKLDKAKSTLYSMIETYPDDYRGYMQMAFLCAEIESRKDNEKRDYNKTQEYYEIAVTYYQDAVQRGVDDIQMKALESLIQELIDMNWIS